MSRIALVSLVLVCVHAVPWRSDACADQFYANGDGRFAWDADSGKKQRSTTWFVKHPSGSPMYRQLAVVIYDRDPRHAVYLDIAEKRVVGRFDLGSGKFSLLPLENQKVRQAIDKYDFPSPATPPAAAALFAPLAADDPSGERLQLPPPTPMHPQLEHSTWDSSYLSADRFTIPCTVRLDGNQGTYELRDKPGTGRLSEVQYEHAADEHIIRGKWNLGQSNGHFQFKVPAGNLNVFWGEFGFQPGKTVGSWNGVREPATSKPRRKTVR